MSSYRFCRTDDLPLLVDAYNRCWVEPAFGESSVAGADLKRDIRELDLWCSSCMVVLAGCDPVGVLLATKRPNESLIHRIAVQPGHRRQGHGRHMLASLSAKLAILGPPRLRVEVPSDRAEAREFFEACGYTAEARYADFVAPGTDSPPVTADFVVPITVNELIDNGVFDRAILQSWERSLETLINRKDQLRGLAIASDERIEAYLLQRPTEGGCEIVALHGADDDRGELALGLLLRHCARQEDSPLRIPRISTDEIPFARLEALGCRREREYIGYAAFAKPG